MIKSKETLDRGIEIDLTGPQGNAFFLLGQAAKWSKQLEYSKTEQEKLQSDMMEGDYENLVKIFDEHFGSFVTLYR